MVEKSFRFPIEAGHVMLFARAVRDPNPIYYAPAEKGEAGIAPPTFVQCSAQLDPDYFLRPKIDEQWHGSGKTPGNALSDEGSAAVGVFLHAEQHFEYKRHPRPGEVFTVVIQEGDSWEKEGRRGGKLRFSETLTEYRDDQGHLVVIGRFIGVQTERPPESVGGE